MYEIRESATYTSWFENLTDVKTRMRIDARIRRASLGNFGDHKVVREGVWELRLDFGPGYRIYYMREGPIVVVLLAGGDKDSQDKDVEVAIRVARDWRSQ